VIFIQQNHEHLVSHLQLIPANARAAVESIKDAGCEAAYNLGLEFDWEPRHHVWSLSMAPSGWHRIGSLVMYTEAEEKDNAWCIADAMLVAIGKVDS